MIFLRLVQSVGATARSAGMNRDGMHPFLKFVLVLVALVVLGPPALGVLAGLIGLAIGLTAIALKLGAVALVVFALVAMFRALFSTPSRQGQPTPIEVSHEDALRRDDEELRALDAELARVMAQQGETA